MKKFFYAVLMTVLAVTMVACKVKKSSGADRIADRTAGEKVDPLNQSEKLAVKIVTLQGYTQPDSRTEKWLEERYNLDITVVALPGWSDATSKISLFMADDAQRPDIIWWWGMDADFAKWRSAGLLVDAAAYMQKYTVMRDYFNSQDPSILFFAASDGGKIYRIPGDVAEPACETLWIRKDWLDNLGLPIPTTLAELDNVLYQFTNNDPDKNGKNDTVGLGGDGYDFRTFWPWVQGSGTGLGHYDNWIIDEQGNYRFGPATEDAKIWLERVAKLYKDGLVTKNIITDTDRDEEMANGGFGVAYSWIAWNNPSYAMMAAFKKAHPESNWIAVPMVKGDNGRPQDNPATIAAWCYFGITKSCKDPERLYAIWDDLAKPENYIRKRFGIEGQEYVKNSDGSFKILVPNNGDENQTKNIGLNLFQDLFSRKDFVNIENTPETTALFERAKADSRWMYSHLTEKKDPNAYTVNNELGSEIGDIYRAYFWSVIAGSRSITEWDKYIADMNAAGMEKIAAEMKEIHGKQRAEQQAYLSSAR